MRLHFRVVHGFVHYVPPEKTTKERVGTDIETTKGGVLGGKRPWPMSELSANKPLSPVKRGRKKAVKEAVVP